MLDNDCYQSIDSNKGHESFSSKQTNHKDEPEHSNYKQIDG